MLKRIPAFIDAELLWVLAAMGHGDRLAVVDRNFPARAIALQTRSQRLVTLGGMDAPASIGGMLELLPLDSFVRAPLAWMDPVDQPGAVLPVHADVLAVCRRAEGRDLGHEVIARHEFYDAATRCFAVVQNAESRPYGCFILTKGVVFDAA
jgi:L-fucose mutarotase